MKENDARSYTTDQQKLLRIKAVDMVFKNGFTQRATAKVLGVSRQHVVKWCQSFSNGGYEALELGRRGRHPGEQMLLKPWQCAVLVNTIRDHTPDQLKLSFVLWERIGVRELIQKKFGITLALRTVGEYLKRWGMTPQRPVERAYERNPQAVENWLNHEYPAIKERAAQEGATILWGDETGVQNQANAGRSYSPSGKTPVIRSRNRSSSKPTIPAQSRRLRLKTPRQLQAFAEKARLTVGFLADGKSRETAAMAAYRLVGSEPLSLSFPILFDAPTDCEPSP